MLARLLSFHSLSICTPTDCTCISVAVSGIPYVVHVFVSESRASGASGGGASVMPSREAHGASSGQGRLLQV